MMVTKWSRTAEAMQQCRDNRGRGQGVILTQPGVARLNPSTGQVVTVRAHELGEAGIVEALHQVADEQGPEGQDMPPPLTPPTQEMVDAIAARSQRLAEERADVLQ